MPDVCVWAVVGAYVAGDVGPSASGFADGNGVTLSRGVRAEAAAAPAGVEPAWAPPAGHRKDENEYDQRVQVGTLVVEGGFGL